MENLPLYISFVFALTTLVTVWLFYRAANYSRPFLFITISWLVIQAIASLTGFYTVTNSFPPRFVLLILPPLVLIAILFVTKRGKRFIEALRQEFLTLLHIVRIPVEFVLYWLFLHKGVPELMTFEGRNFDILSGLTAPFIFYFGYIRKKISRSLLLLWNFACLGLLVNIVVNAVFSAPFPFQKFAFDQPNIAVLYFPFTGLPCCVVPLVLFSHLATIRQLLRKKSTPEEL